MHLERFEASLAHLERALMNDGGPFWRGELTRGKPASQEWPATLPPPTPSLRAFFAWERGMTYVVDPEEGFQPTTYEAAVAHDAVFTNGEWPWRI